MIIRPRRLRSSDAMRRLVRTTHLSKDMLIYPMFVQEGTGICREINAMPGQFRYSLDMLCKAVEQVSKAGIGAIMLFGIPEQKDELGSGAWAQGGVVQQAIQLLKREFPQMLLVADVCLCEYTDHGHCGVLAGDQIDNDMTLPLLAETALSFAQAGVDIVAPSDMMDGRVLAIREKLDAEKYFNIPIMSYAVKYASSFYGPFREAAGSAPSFGDRKTYQMDYHNSKEAIREALLDVEEGADMLIVKPALSYLDIISDVNGRVNIPVAAYSVSGEYSMIKAAAAAGYIDEVAVACESTVSIVRAGADILISYYAREIAGWIDEGRIG